MKPRTFRERLFKNPEDRSTAVETDYISFKLSDSLTNEAKHENLVAVE